MHQPPVTIDTVLSVTPSSLQWVKVENSDVLHLGVKSLKPRMAKGERVLQKKMLNRQQQHHQAPPPLQPQQQQQQQQGNHLPVSNSHPSEAGELLILQHCLVDPQKICATTDHIFVYLIWFIHARFLDSSRSACMVTDCLFPTC